MLLLFYSLYFFLQSFHLFSSPPCLLVILRALLPWSFLFMMSLISLILILPHFLLHFTLLRLLGLRRLLLAPWLRLLLHHVSRGVLIIWSLWLLRSLNWFFLSWLTLPLFFWLTGIISFRFLCLRYFLNWNNYWYIFLSFNYVWFLLKWWCLRSLYWLQYFISHFINLLLKIIYLFPFRNLIVFIVITHIDTVIIRQPNLKCLSTNSFNYLLILFNHNLHFFIIIYPIII